MCTALQAVASPLGHSTAGLMRLHPRADDGIGTRDPHLGKVMRYQLRYIRAPRATPSPVAKDDDSPPERGGTNLFLSAAVTASTDAVQILAEVPDRANLRRRSDRSFVHRRGPRSRSSAGERPPHTRKVAGSKPAGTTTIIKSGRCRTQYRDTRVRAGSGRVGQRTWRASFTSLMSAFTFSTFCGAAGVTSVGLFFAEECGNAGRSEECRPGDARRGATRNTR